MAMVLRKIYCTTRKARHFGLKGMGERATKIGAALTISSSPHTGTVVRLAVQDDTNLHDLQQAREASLCTKMVSFAPARFWSRR